MARQVALGGFELDHFRAHVTQVLARQGTKDHGGNFKNANTFKGPIFFHLGSKYGNGCQWAASGAHNG